MVRRLVFVLVAIVVSCGEPETGMYSRASFSITPPSGDTVTLFLFDATSSVTRTQDLWRVKARWDWENDGIWDTDYSLDKTAIHRFSKFGIHHVKLEILDNSGENDTLTKMCSVNVFIKDSFIIDARDNQKYSVKKINNVWWMTQDLAFGKIISNASSPRDDGIAERWVYPDSGQTDQAQQGFYTELEATDYYRNLEGGICPKGWKIPKTNDCVILNSFFWNQWSFFARNDSINYQFNPVFHGFYYTITAKFYDNGLSNYYLIHQIDKVYSYSMFTEQGFSPAWWNLEMQSAWEHRLRVPFNRQWLGFSLRCIKKAL